jgi:hypothetical protein
VTGTQDGSGSEICKQVGDTFWPRGGGIILALTGETLWPRWVNDFGPTWGKHYGPGGGIVLALDTHDGKQKCPIRFELGTLLNAKSSRLDSGASVGNDVQVLPKGPLRGTPVPGTKISR